MTDQSEPTNIVGRSRREPCAAATDAAPFGYLLPGLRVAPIEETEFSIWLAAEQYPKLQSCPYCGCEDERFKRNGTRSQIVRDVPCGIRSVYLEIKRQSYSCRKCKTPFQQTLPAVEGNCRMTTRLVDFIRKLSLFRPAREVALLTGSSAKTVSGILTKYRQHLDKSVCFETPRVLGLDGVYARVEKEEQEEAAHGKKGSVKRKRRKTVKKECICVTDIEKGIAIDLWPHASKESIVNSLRRLPEPERIKVVIIDMSSVLYSAVREALPWAVIVIDIFHVQSKANVGVDNVRKRLRKGIRRVKGHPTMCPKELLRKHRDPRRPEKAPPELKGWFDLMPELRLAYEIKESFFDIWVSSCTRTALKRYQLWLEKFPPELRKDFAELLSALHNWKEEIFNYFDYPFTNGFTEGRNRLEAVS